MHLRHLTLANFRCYRALDLVLPSGTIVVSGSNAQGKSSLLEAIYVLATTRSPHAGADRELIHWAAQTEPMPYSRVRGEVARKDGDDTVEIVGVLQPGDGNEPRYVKRARVNDAPRRALDAIGVLNVVLFTPRDLQLVDGAPAERRRYLDILRCQVDHAYCSALMRFNKVLVQRNHLLRRLRDRGGDRGELTYWDDEIARHGGLVIARRAATVAALDEIAGALHAELVGGAGRLGIHYRASLFAADGGGPDPSSRARPDEDPPRVPGEAGEATMATDATEATAARGASGESEAIAASGASDAAAAASPVDAVVAAYRAALAARRDEEIGRGVTVIGPHRDDLAFTVDEVDMRTYGSRGQQRTVTLALKLAEARLMWRERGERPVLLLDDVLSELDEDRRALLLAHVDTHQQTFLTTTDLERLPADFRTGAHVLQVADAAVEAR